MQTGLAEGTVKSHLLTLKSVQAVPLAYMSYIEKALEPEDIDNRSHAAA